MRYVIVENLCSSKNFMLKFKNQSVVLKRCFIFFNWNSRYCNFYFHWKNFFLFEKVLFKNKTKKKCKKLQKSLFFSLN